MRIPGNRQCLLVQVLRQVGGSAHRLILTSLHRDARADAHRYSNGTDHAGRAADEPAETAHEPCWVAARGLASQASRAMSATYRPSSFI
ncbi:hypothetical protein [Mycobacterium tuberculosis]|uniref:hypothetical protein n=1 Tax=Mycobacterium tuberculosis TaxID=1773 RepID=UPI00070E784B|nr:hypothetical protein [Mycobacterium tuberculosis]